MGTWGPRVQRRFQSMADRRPLIRNSSPPRFCMPAGARPQVRPEPPEPWVRSAAGGSNRAAHLAGAIAGGGGLGDGGEPDAVFLGDPAGMTARGIAEDTGRITTRKTG
jgi:hypothetical protein